MKGKVHTLRARSLVALSHALREAGWNRSVRKNGDVVYRYPAHSGGGSVEMHVLVIAPAAGRFELTIATDAFGNPVSKTLFGGLGRVRAVLSREGFVF